MAQHGSQTVIPARVRLILFDCFETLVELRGPSYVVRTGVADLLAHFHRQRGVSLAVLSDAAEEQVVAALTQAGIADRFARVYHAANASEDLGEGRTRKRLDVPLRDFACDRDDAIFVGDSPSDASAAQHYQVPFIRVPRSEDRGFSFATLISGPSRYSSAEFSAAFIAQYLQRQPPMPPLEGDGAEDG
jgi:FMN phosphatase YigB (HAD superfamily)